MRGRGEDEPQDSYRLTGSSRKRPERPPRPRNVPAQPSLPLKCQSTLAPAERLRLIVLAAGPRPAPLPPTYVPGLRGWSRWQPTSFRVGARVLITHHQPALGGAGSSHSETWPWKVRTATYCSLSCLFLLGRAVLVIFLPPCESPTGLLYDSGIRCGGLVGGLFPLSSPLLPPANSQTHFQWTQRP